MSDWQLMRLEELAAPTKSSMATGPFGSAVSSKNFRVEGVPMLRGSNLSEDLGVRLVESDLVYLEPELASTFARSIARPGDLVFTCWGSVGQIGLIEDSSRYGHYVVSNKQMKFTPDKSKVDSLFVYYYLSQPRMLELVKGQAIGSTIPGFNLGQLRALPVRVPQIRVQLAIAEVLGALDDKIAANSKLAEAAAALAQVLYEQGVEGVDMQPMSAALTPILGGTPSRANPNFWGGDHWWASAKDITGASGSVIISTEETISGVALAQTKAKPLPIDSVILTARGTVGAVARLAVPASFNQSCYGFTPDQAPAAILYFGIFNAMQRAKAIAHGSVFDTITMKTFDHLEFPAFADGVGEELDGKIGPLLDTVVARVKENRTLAELRDTLLPELMSGRLRVRGAEAAASEVGL